MKIVPLITASTVALAFSVGFANAKGRGFDLTDLDTNGDGSITAAELSAAHASRFTDADTDNNGSLTKEELTAYINEIRENGNEDRIGRMVSRMFNHLDDDDNGEISAEEHAAADRSERMLERLDEDGDGAISAEEAEDAHGKGRKGGKGGKRGDHGGKRGGHGKKDRG